MSATSIVRSVAAVSIALVATTLSLVVPGRSAGRAALPEILDGYVFPGSDPGRGRAVFAFDVAPLFGNVATNALFFDPNVVYTIDVDNVGDRRVHLVMQFKAEGTGPLQRIVMYGPAVPAASDGAPVDPATGVRTTLVRQLGTATYNEATTLDEDVSLFAGPRRDPFSFDAEQFAAIRGGRATCFRPAASARNALTRANVLAIVVEVPRSLVAPRKAGRVGVWWTASVADPAGTPGTYHQVSRAGRPLVARLVETMADQTASDRLPPDGDAAFAAAVRRFVSSPPPGLASRSDAMAAALETLFAPDELEADVQAPGAAGYLRIETATPTPSPLPSVKHVPPPYRPFGGRRPDEAASGTLGAFFGDTLPRALLAPEDGRETPCLASDNTTPPPNPSASSFPYLDAPF